MLTLFPRRWFVILMLCGAVCAGCSPAPKISGAAVTVSPIPASDTRDQVAIEAFACDPDNPSFELCGEQIYLLELGQDVPVRLLRGTDAAWSPDGNQLAFYDYYGQNFEHQGIFVLDASGRVTQLTGGPVRAQRPVWSPDGTRLVFEILGDAFWWQGPDPRTIYVVKADGSELMRLGDGLSPAWSPDGQHLALVAGWDERTLVVMDADGANPRSLSATAPYPNQTLAWSPDGTRIAYWRVREGSPNSSGISVVDVASGTVTDVTDYFDHDPVWSPDGQTLAFVRGSAYREIYTVNADGSGLTQLTFGQDTEIDDYEAGWSEDGRFVTFVSSEEEDNYSYSLHLCQIGRDGGGATCPTQVLLDTASPIRAVWRP